MKILAILACTASFGCTARPIAELHPKQGGSPLTVEGSFLQYLTNRGTWVGETNILANGDFDLGLALTSFSNAGVAAALRSRQSQKLAKFLESMKISRVFHPRPPSRSSPPGTAFISAYIIFFGYERAVVAAVAEDRSIDSKVISRRIYVSDRYSVDGLESWSQNSSIIFERFVDEAENIWDTFDLARLENSGSGETVRCLVSEIQNPECSRLGGLHGLTLLSVNNEKNTFIICPQNRVSTVDERQPRIHN